jgi:hypothetical protein
MEHWVSDFDDEIPNENVSVLPDALPPALREEFST